MGKIDDPRLMEATAELMSGTTDREQKCILAALKVLIANTGPRATIDTFPATGYRDLSGQTVELPAYRLNGTEAEYIGMQEFTFPGADTAAEGGQV